MLRLIPKGLNRRQAAGALFIAEGTVRSHLGHIYSKIGVSNRATAGSVVVLLIGLLPGFVFLVGSVLVLRASARQS